MLGVSFAPSRLRHLPLSPVPRFAARRGNVVSRSPVPAFSGTLRSENQRVAGTLEFLVRGIPHSRVSFVAQTPPLFPLFLVSVWLLVAEVSFSPLLRAPCRPKRAPDQSRSAPCHTTILSPVASQSPLPAPVSNRDLLSWSPSPGFALPRTSALSRSDPFAVSRPPTSNWLTCSCFPGTVSAASIVRLSNFPLILVFSFHSVYTRLT